MNKEREQYDVVVVGAGPAGLSTSLECAKNGVRVLLIEESPMMETEKSWVTFSDTIEDYPPVKKAVTNTVDRLKFYGPREYFDSGRTLIKGYLIEQALMNKAYQEELDKSGTCDILDGTKYQKGARENNLIRVKTSKGVFKGKIIIDCSGSYSMVADDLGVPNGRFWASTCYFLRIYKKDALADFGCVVFSSGGFDSSLIGHMGALYPSSRDYFEIGIGNYLKTNSLRRFHQTEMVKLKLRRQIINLWNFYQKKSLIGKEIKIDFKKEFYGVIRVTPRRHIHGDNIVLVGDAAGQGSPITGEGLRTGLYYGKMAGKVISEAIKKNDYSKETLKKYSDLCRKKPLYGYGYGLLVQKLIKNNLGFNVPFKKFQDLYNKNKPFGINYGLKIIRNEPLSFQEITRLLMKLCF